MKLPLKIRVPMQDVSTMLRFGVKPIIFLINNKVLLKLPSLHQHPTLTVTTSFSAACSVVV